MKTKWLILSLALFSAAALDAADNAATRPAKPERTFSSFDTPSRSDEPMARGSIKFENAEVDHILKLYQELSGRSIIRAASVQMTTKITFENVTALTRVEALQALDNVLAANGIAMIYRGTQYVKVVPVGEAVAEAAPVIELPPDQLPESSSYLTYIVELKNRTPEEAIMALQPFAKMPNSLIAMKGSEVLVLRDYSINVRRMLQVLERIEKAPRTPETDRRTLPPSRPLPR